METKEPRKPIIALLTDFGETDWFVGAMKGVIKNIAPDVGIIDVSHDLADQSVLEAAFLLANVYSWYPKRTIFLCVVDPGVGTKRKAMVAKIDGYVFVAPDNGIISCVAENATDIEAYEVSNVKYMLSQISNTFQGRDIFAAAAAHVANGVQVSSMGPPISSPVFIPLPQPKILGDNTIEGEIVYIDKFGNLITNIKASSIKASDFPKYTVEIRSRTIRGISRTYANAPRGKLVALIGSSGRLEIAQNRGSASDSLKAKISDTIQVGLLQNS